MSDVRGIAKIGELERRTKRLETVLRQGNTFRRGVLRLGKRGYEAAAGNHNHDKIYVNGQETIVITDGAGGAFIGSVDYWRIGNTVFVDGVINRPSSFNTAYAGMQVTLNADYRPVATHAFPPSTFFNTSITYQFRIITDGSLEVRQSAANTTDMVLNGFFKVAP